MGVDLVTCAKRYSIGLQILREVAAKSGRSALELTGTCRSADLVTLRLRVITRARDVGIGRTTLGRVLKRDPATIHYHMKGGRLRDGVWVAAKREREAQHG